MTISVTDAVTKQLLSIEQDRDWEDLILSGPTTVNFLGLLMISASRSDIALTSRPQHSVQFIQNTNSLHVTLFQVASSMQMTFHDAHGDLVRTCLYMDQIPEHMKATLMLIKMASDELMQTLLPYSLRNIDRDTTEALTFSKPMLSRFIQTGKLIDEVVAVISSTLSDVVTSIDDYYYLSEVETYAIDLQVQWYLLVELFIQFSDMVELIRKNVKENFMNPVQQAQDGNGVNIVIDRLSCLQTLIPSTITIDHSAHFLRMMVHTYVKIYNTFMITQVNQTGSLLALQTESMRITNRRDLFKTTLAQSIAVARLASVEHTEFIRIDIDRQKEYTLLLLEDVVAAKFT